MTSSSRRRLVLAIVLVNAAGACGVSAVGSWTPGGAEPPPEAGGRDVLGPDGAEPADTGAGDGGLDALADAPPADAPNDAPCPSVCNGGCDLGGCHVTCTTASPCTSVVCPSGMGCTVACTGNGACANGVDCTQATACNVTCDNTAMPGNPGTCGSIACAGLACGVTCSGGKTCQDNVTCDAGTCVLGCNGQHSCCTQPKCATGSVCFIDAGGGTVGGC